MNRLTAVAAGALAALLVAAPVVAGQGSGTTTVPAAQPSGSTIDVVVSVDSAGPVVPYEYAIQNECSFPKHVLTLQHDDIVYWTYEVEGVPHAVMPVYLQSIPSGAKCKVFLLKNNTVVKGSTTTYTVDDPV
jgi:hypothetical protein